MLRANLLVTGPDEALARFVDAVLPNVRQPVVRWAGHGPLPPSVEECGTVIVENVGTLAPDDQRRLFDWLTVTHGKTQIVSTTADGLLSLVKTGIFLEELYYRLNTVYIDLTASPPDVLMLNGP